MNCSFFCFVFLGHKHTLLIIYTVALLSGFCTSLSMSCNTSVAADVNGMRHLGLQLLLAGGRYHACLHKLPIKLQRGGKTQR